MSEDIKLKDSELFMELPLEQQEAIAGGRSSSPFALFLQKIDTMTFANNEITSATGASYRQQTGYTTSQLTLGINPSFGGGGGRRRGRKSSRSSGSFLDMLFGLMSLF